MLLNEISSIVPATEKTVFSVRGKLSDHYPITLNVNEYGLVSLEGCPTIVDGNFNCSTNNLVLIINLALSKDFQNLLETIAGQHKIILHHFIIFINILNKLVDG